MLTEDNPASRAQTASPANPEQRGLPSPASTEASDSGIRNEESDLVDGAPAPPMGPTESPLRTLKLVLTLTPVQTAGYRALLALGTDGCDPVMRSVEVADLSAAFQEMAALIAAAEARWRMQPRNSATIKRAGGKAAKHTNTKQRPAEQQPSESGRPASDDAPAQSSDQLPLFG
jgi:hypothetical protein